jgi:peptidoglycan/LPS O-acetylase OafA/YrhL
MENPQSSRSARNLQLDCLRGVAILLVICRHTILFRKPSWDEVLVQFGWAGVDLFFVLSGFLISGLLFSEYRLNNSIRFGRFAIRRALKIYPAFYALVLLTVFIHLIHHSSVPILAPLLHDVFFLQSYLPGTYGHFWSLSVEEHFYIFLPLLTYLMIRRSSSTQENPFYLFPAVFVFVAITLLLARLWTANHVLPFSWQTHLFPTHLRIDSLLFGVFLSYWAQFHGRAFWGFVRPRSPLFLLVGLFLISPGLFLTQETPWMYTYGFSLLYFGFGAILLGTLGAPIELMPGTFQFLARILAFVGRYSYSIYLWHIPLLIFLASYGILRRPYVGVGTFVVGSIALGVLASELFEIPVIRLRDTLFPQSSAKIQAHGSDSTSRIELGINAKNSKPARVSTD